MTINLFDCFQLNLKTFRTKSLHIINTCIFFRTKKNSKKPTTTMSSQFVFKFPSVSLLYMLLSPQASPKCEDFPIPSYPSLLDHRRDVAMFLQNLREIGRVWHLKSHDGFLGRRLFQWPKIHRLYWGYVIITPCKYTIITRHGWHFVGICFLIVTIIIYSPKNPNPKRDNHF